MTRTISLASVLFIAALWVPGSAQTPASSGKVADDKAASNTTLPTNKSGRRTLADYVQDSSTESVEMTVTGIEKILRETHVITVRFNGHQVSLPVVSRLEPAKIAESILSQAKSIPGLQLHAGKTALLISTESNLGSAMVLPLAKVIFIEPGERKEVTNPPADSSINAGDGLPVTQLGPGDLLKQGLLDKAESISVMLGTYNIVLPLSDKSPRRALAEALEKLREGKHSYSFLDGRKTLCVMTKPGGLEPLMLAFIGILNAAGDPPKASDANTKAGGGISISVPALGPGEFGGGGGLFGGFAPPLPAQAMPSKNYVMGKNIVIALSEKGDRAWGYSKKLGKWTTLKLDSPSEKAFPVLGDEVACVINVVTPSDEGKGRFVWGYSPITGGWDKLTLPAGSKAQPMVQTDMILVEDGDYVQIFSAQSGKWSAPPKPDDGVVENTGTPVGLPGPPNLNTPGDPAQSDRDVRTPVIKIAELKRAQATDVAATLKQIFRDAQITFVPDVRTNAVVVSAPDDQQQIINTLIDMLDQDLPAGTPGSRDPVTAMKSDTVRINASQLKEQYEAQERKAGAIAKQLQDAPAPAAAVKATLRKAVAEAFTLRQQLHQAELAAFQQRMAKVQQTIRMRDQLKEQIIDRRVEDLLKPELNWDSAPRPKSVAKSGPTELDGEWQLQSIRGDGIIAYEQDLKLRIENQQWIILRGENESPYSLVLDSTTHPKSIDLVAELEDGRPSQRSKGIYKVDGDKLISAWGTDPKVRPAAFEGHTVRVHTWQRIKQENLPSAQVRITGPEGATIALRDQPASGYEAAVARHVIPVRLNLIAGKSHEFQLSNIPDHANLDRQITIEIPSPSGPTANNFLTLNSIPLELTNEDLAQVSDGNPLTKVLYLPDQARGGPMMGMGSNKGTRSVNSMMAMMAAPVGVDVLVSTRLDPGVDAVAEADKRGTVLAIARLAAAKVTAELSAPKTEVIRGNPSDGKQTPGRIGVVKEVRLDGLVLLSVEGPEKVARRDALHVIRRENDVDSAATYRWIAKLEVISIESNSEVLAREMQSASKEKITVGDEIRWTAETTTDLSSSTGTPASTTPPDGRLILKSVEDFQQRLITVESAINSHREDLRQARLRWAAGTGEQASIDACQTQVDAWGKKLAVIRAELEAQIKLLELEGKFAKRASEIAEAEYLKALQANKVLPGTHTDLEIRRLKLRWESAALKMEQATVLLGLYQKVAPESKPATPATDPMGATSAITPNEERIWKTLGLRLTQAAPSAIHKANSVYNGGLDVLEVRPDSPAAVDGRIQQGDILCGLHVWRIESIDHVMFVLNHHEFSVFQPLKFFVLRDGKTLSGHMKVGASAPPPSELVSPPSTEEISKKNLSDLMLALHHYHDQHKHFPPAVIMGKDGKGKVPHSWRVEILPHLGEQKLYDEYHFDEAWNSEHNQKLLDRMPAVFRSPLDRPESYSTSYFALVTPGLKPQGSSGAAAGTGDASEVLRYDLGTVFSNPRGAQLLDIHDGTARTVALVESKRSVAWMQPEDIPYSADQPVPLLGGWYVDGWNAAFADGTVKMISNQNTDAILRAIFTIGDGINALPKVVDDSAEEAGTVPPASKN